jgi:hypothetical protein
MTRLLSDLADIYGRDIVDVGKQPQFFILVSFLVTFIVVRAITHLIRSNRLPFVHNLSAGGVHVHHLVWGILLLLGTGYVAIALSPERGREVLAVLFGIGAALTLDEFALWLRLKDVYWAREGRRSIDAVIIAAAIFTLAVLGLQFWANAARAVGDAIGLL